MAAPGATIDRKCRSGHFFVEEGVCRATTRTRTVPWPRPPKRVLNFDHEVRQWMSRVILVCGSALNSDQLHALTGQGPTFSVKVQSAGSIRGVGPAVSTGRLSTRCCPGRIRSDSSDPDWRPVKPRVTVADFLRAGVWNQSSGAVASGRRPGPHAHGHERRARCP